MKLIEADTWTEVSALPLVLIWFCLYVVALLCLGIGLYLFGFLYAVLAILFALYLKPAIYLLEEIGIITRDVESAQLIKAYEVTGYLCSSVFAVQGPIEGEELRLMKEDLERHKKKIGVSDGCPYVLYDGFCCCSFKACDAKSVESCKRKQRNEKLL